MNDATLVKPQSPTVSEETKTPSAEERTNLQYWLANEDVYTSAYVRKWLERTPPAEAAEMLAAISEYARPESRSLLRMFLQGLISTLTTAEIISPNTPAGRKAGIRAAMLLANLHDLRALAPLARVFEAHWFWQGKYQQAVETALLHLLSDAPTAGDWTPYRTDLRKVAEVIRQIGRGRQELTVRQADLMIAALEHLAPISGEDALLKTVASAEARHPQQQRVKSAVSALLNGRVTKY